MPIFMKIEGVDGDVSAAHSEANVELTVKVLDAGGTFYGAMTGVDLAVRVVDTETGHVTERESGLVYSGESGGLNESSTDVGGHYTQIMWDDTSGPMKESMETMKKAWKDASSTPEGKTTSDGDTAQGGDGGFGTPYSDLTMPNEARTEATQNTYSWGLDRIDMSPSDVQTAQSLGSWAQHGAILTGNPAAADRPGPFMGVYVGSGGTTRDSGLDDDAPTLELKVEGDGGIAYQGLMFYTAKVVGDTYPAGFTGGVYVAAGDVSEAGYDAIGRLVAVTDAGVHNDGGGDLNDWQSHYGSGGSASAHGTGGGGDDVLIGGLTGFEQLPVHVMGFDLA